MSVLAAPIPQRCSARARPKSRRIARTLAAWLLLTGFAVAAESAPKKANNEEPPSTDQLYELGKSLFEQYAPAEIKEEYEFPSKEQWDQFAARLQQGLEQDDLSLLAQYEPEARSALTALRAFPGYEDYADWLEERLDYIEAAKTATSAEAVKPTPAPSPSTPVPAPTAPAPRATKPASLPYYDLWLQRVQSRPVPERAGKLMPLLRDAFAEEGVPPEIAWLAEAESTLNPSARSPAGAKGLFQLMPETARNLGLSTFIPDERGDPEKSARAAAKYLRELHGKFGSWPLAFAAYNGGEGRVRRLLKQKDASTFAEIASALPSETRMYVPKVCATIAVRSGVAPGELAPPRAS
ncbi:lytic transglycosylase domain-containing protein [Opitutus terrae]|uniref:Lytic transglycosylase catalytic n=1 Tax=Opitutus terrae (strain DSM 11246 / JCM 15787 / PB90-1) TaxID=452637 RepID=B1ZVI9_OPITP|nr:lytic transglycosylase domain-containing protein [Opitutus terrae]ACB74086.1 Lytic transglycosylase catalytic [Opitutus terrae PB90-1]